MLIVHGIRPAWGLPCVSPFVTKLVWWLRLAGLDFELRPQDPATLASDSPNGKLPWVLWPDGRRLADTEAVIAALAAAHGDPLDAGLDALQRATALAFTRLADEHLYWAGVIAPRWADDAQWPAYCRELFGADVLPPPLQAWAEAKRAEVLAQWRGSGQGCMPPAVADARAAADVQALAAVLARQPWMGGERPRGVDAAVGAMLAHVLDAPFDSAAARAARQGACAAPLRAYVDRLQARCGA